MFISLPEGKEFLYDLVMRNYVVFMDQLNSWWLMNIINNMSSQNPCWLMILWGYITIREREIPFLTNQHKWTTRGFEHVLLYY